MEEYRIIQYLLDAIEHNYLEELLINSIESSKFSVTAVVSDCQRIKPVLWMIEANMYTNKNLLAENVKSNDSVLEINSLDGITYIINVVSK